MFLRFAAVARVTEDSWTACAVLDRINFGLQVGGELDVTTTLCHEIHTSHETIIISKASEDRRYCDHHTPKMYGFESYISTPVFRTDGSFFGTVCALDPRPADGLAALFAQGENKLTQGWLMQVSPTNR